VLDRVKGTFDKLAGYAALDAPCARQLWATTSNGRTRLAVGESGSELASVVASAISRLLVRRMAVCLLVVTALTAPSHPVFAVTQWRPLTEPGIVHLSVTTPNSRSGGRLWTSTSVSTHMQAAAR